MSISAFRVASVLADRLEPAVPSPFRVRAVGPQLQVDHPDDWGFTLGFEWMEAEAEGRSTATLLELAVDSALSHLQDAVAESTTEPWPALSEQGQGSAMASCQMRWEGEELLFWYGIAEATPLVSFAPIPLHEVEAKR
jgi:hypothetical protein